MEFTVACNWQDDLLEKLDYPEITSLFGGLPETVISGGRYSGMIDPAKWEKVGEYIKKVHSKGWEFLFNVNSTCLANKELEPEGYREIVTYLGQLSDIGVDGLTVSLPTLVEIIKKNFPAMKIKISTYQKINSVGMARRFEELGADALMLSEHINRDLKLIKAIRKAVKCKIIVIPNVGCIYACPNMFTHSTAIAHSGAKSEKKSGFFSEIHSFNCLSSRLRDPVEFIKTRWIRPEDIDKYEEAGVDEIKIIDRNSSTDALLERVEAYHKRSYKGNLINLLGQVINIKRNIMFNIDYIVGKINDDQMRKLQPIFDIIKDMDISDLIYLDNSKIPADFLERFMKQNCALVSCETCKFCNRIADTAMTIHGNGKIQELTDQLELVKNGVADGSLLY